MGGIVLRCPNCGTVQPMDGECEACREASVRYFCTNHDPGIWTDSPSCPRCGARFGEPAPVREPAREAPPPPPERRRAPAPEVLEPGAETFGREPDPGPWSESGRMAGGGRPAAPDPRKLLLAMLGAAARARRAPPEGFDYEEEAPRRRRGGGCIGRLLMLALLLFALMLLIPALLGALLSFG